MSVDERTDDRQSDLAVMEGNEYKIKRRLQRLLDAREKCEERADEAYDLYVTGEIGDGGKNIILLRAVREYVREAWQLLLDHAREGESDDLESEYLFERHLGTVEFERGEGVRIDGLFDFLHCPETFTETVVEQTHHRHKPDETVRRERTHYVPEDVSWQAFLLVSEFLATEHDMMLQFEDLDDDIPTREPDEIDELEQEAFHDAVLEAKERMENGDVDVEEAAE